MGGEPRRASMEGRAIARPNQSNNPNRCPFNTNAIRPRASMEGRAIARPNIQAKAWWDENWDASMEGRAIARPNTSVAVSAGNGKV